MLVILEILVFLAILEGSKLRFLACATKDLCKKIPHPRVRVREIREISVECNEVLLIISPPFIPPVRWGKGAISGDCARIYIKECGADDAGDAA